VPALAPRRRSPRAHRQPGLVAQTQLFYDGPAPPPGIFDAFLAIPALSGNATAQSFLAFFGALPNTPVPRCAPRRAADGAPADSCARRILFDTAPVLNYSAPLLAAVINESLVRSSSLIPRPSSRDALACHRN
jgi:hypothetical protein